MFAKIVLIFLSAAILYTVAEETCRKDCADRDPQCPLLQNLCKSNSAVKSTCPMTCGECVVCSKPEEATPQCELGTCKDIMSPLACALYKKYNYGCLIVSTRCRATCGYCQNCKLPPTTTEPTCSDDCADKHDACQYWGDNGYCDPEMGYADTRDICPLTCNVCKPCPVRKPLLPPVPEEQLNKV